ncbi:MAG TPA: undecaprenyl-diphosphate phosphatase [Pirellulales bacterium]|jgi:undecaprenyl-diphosphatase|nr:undecaprenyl-diphosphate phosphatase [Pirellulales bacterium]
MQYLQVLLLGIIQGIAEFLPISSKGHLVIGGALLYQFTGQRLPDMIELTILLHVGTLASILVVYWRRVWRLVGPDRRVIGMMAVGTIPAVVLGLPLHEIHAFRQWFSDPLLVGCLLPVTGILLLASSRIKPGDVDYTQMTYRQALLIGCCQALALLPGISRSGTTIVAGLLVGLRRDSAATFSFFLAIPVILGAAVLESKDLLAGGSGEPLGPLLLGVLASFVVGVASLKLLLRWLNQGHLAWFAWWCIPVGLAVVAWQRFL